MPAYNFQKQFVPMILDGSKTHTIRRRRKYPTKEGSILSLYVGMRTKSCKLIAEVPCENVIPVLIYPFQKRFAANILDDFDTFVREDGFENTDDFFEFFERYEQDALTDFEVIYWDPKKMIKADEFVTHRCKCAVEEVKR